MTRAAETLLVVGHALIFTAALVTWGLGPLESAFGSLYAAAGLLSCSKTHGS